MRHSLHIGDLPASGLMVHLVTSSEMDIHCAAQLRRSWPCLWVYPSKISSKTSWKTIGPVSSDWRRGGGKNRGTWWWTMLKCPATPWHDQLWPASRSQTWDQEPIWWQQLAVSANRSNDWVICRCWSAAKTNELPSRSNQLVYWFNHSCSAVDCRNAIKCTFGWTVVIHRFTVHIYTNISLATCVYPNMFINIYIYIYTQ